MEKPFQLYIFAFINLAVFVAIVTVNALANILPLNGIGTGELSDLYPNLFVPAGITFSVWGVIYLFLACFSVYSIIAVFKASIDASFLSEINIWFLVSGIANIGWIFAWHWKRLSLSLLFMALILASLIIIYLKLSNTVPQSKIVYILTRLPFSIYLGWITVATIANITAFLVNLNLKGYFLSEEAWTVIVITAAVIITCLIIVTRRDIGYSLVVIWALLGIVIKRSAVGDATEVVISAITAIVVITAVLIIRLIKS